MRTAGMIQQGTPNPDGHVFFPILPSNFISGAGTYTRGGKGQIYSVVAASTNVIIEVALSSLLFRYGVQDDLQQLWGSTISGGSQGKATPPATYVSQAPLLQRAPFTGSSQLIPPTSRPTGISIMNLIPVFTIATVTLNTIGISKTQFANGANPVVTDILAPYNAGTGNSNLTASPVIPVNTTFNFQTSRLAEYLLEWQVNVGAGGAAVLYGFFLDIAYNYN